MGCGPSETVKKSANPYKQESRKMQTTKATTSKSGVNVDLAISPDQFIVENPEDIKKTYTFEKKLGEGNFTLNQRCFWCCV
jgi:hypothetical protein